MSSLRRAIPLFSAIVALALSACAAPYLKTAANQPDPKPSPALVAGLNVRFDNAGQDKGLIGAAVDAAQNSQLDEFGKKATDMLAAALADRGYTPAYDAPRSQ